MYLLYFFFYLLFIKYLSNFINIYFSKKHEHFFIFSEFIIFFIHLSLIFCENSVEQNYILFFLIYLDYLIF